MTNLDSILKSRDITLPTKVRLVKAIVFPVVVYGCESWTVKKADIAILISDKPAFRTSSIIRDIDIFYNSEKIESPRRLKKFRMYKYIII